MDRILKDNGIENANDIVDKFMKDFGIKNHIAVRKARFKVGREKTYIKVVTVYYWM